MTDHPFDDAHLYSGPIDRDHTTLRPNFLAMAAEDIPAGALVGLDKAGHLRRHGREPVAGIPVEGNLQGLGAARVALQRDLDAAETRRAEASLRITDAEDAYREANEEVIEIETALADLSRLEAGQPTDYSEGDPHR